MITIDGTTFPEGIQCPSVRSASLLCFCVYCVLQSSQNLELHIIPSRTPALAPYTSKGLSSWLANDDLHVIPSILGNLILILFIQSPLPSLGHRMPRGLSRSAAQIGLQPASKSADDSHSGRRDYRARVQDGIYLESCSQSCFDMAFYFEAVLHISNSRIITRNN